jgi:hypothetical protein
MQIRIQEGKNRKKVRKLHVLKVFSFEGMKAFPVTPLWRPRDK